MKNKVFNTWIRELATLVFTQAMQAFVLAIIMSVVVNLFVTSLEDNAEALGIYAIIAMASLSKIELLVKNIFGIKSGVADTSMAAGRKSLLKGGLAVRGIMRLGNNIPNMVAGAGGLVGSAFGLNSESRRVKLAREKVKALEDSEKTAKSNSNAKRIAGRTSIGNRRLAEMKKQSEANNKKNDDKKDEKDPRAELRDAEAALRKKDRENFSKLSGGAMETIGAVHGATLGAAVGLATGGEDMISDMAIGAGIGDTIGATANRYSVGLYNQAVNELDQVGIVNDKVKEQKSKNREYNKASRQIISDNNRLIANAANNNTANIANKSDAKVVRNAQRASIKEDKKELNKINRDELKANLKNKEKGKLDSVKNYNDLRGQIKAEAREERKRANQMYSDNKKKLRDSNSIQQQTNGIQTNSNGNQIRRNPNNNI